MATICPTITATDEEDYVKQINQVKDFGPRIHIDLMDGQFTASQSLDLDQVWWPANLKADLHAMYAHPDQYLDKLIELAPNLVIIHFEAQTDHIKLALELKQQDIKAGLAILSETPVEAVKDLLAHFDHLLIFGGHLGYQGGEAKLEMLPKINQAKQLKPDIEIAWDGGVSAQNAAEILKAGADVLDVGSYIQSSSDPRTAYAKLKSVLTD